jgi:hypothetical protein
MALLMIISQSHVVFNMQVCMSEIWTWKAIEEDGCKTKNLEACL